MRIPSARPAEQGVAAEGILAFVGAVEADPAIEPHGLIIQRHGHRIAEGYWAPHTPGRARLVYSLSKSFTGSALALQIGEGRLALDDLVSDHLPECFAAADERTKRMRIRNIVSMATGHNREMIDEAVAADPDDTVRGFFSIPPDGEPGTVFAYSQPPVLALATILQRNAGERLVDYLRPRLLDPLGIGDFRWTQHSPGIDLGYSGVHTTLDAVARLGQLYLDDGMCDANRILPEGWVAEASRPQVANPDNWAPDWQQGYCIQLWKSRHGYRGDGAYGQYMVILPEHDAVIAMYTCSSDLQRVLDLMWEHLLPAIDAVSPDAREQDDALAVRLAALVQPTVQRRIGVDSGPVRLAPARMEPATKGPNANRTITAVEVDDGTTAPATITLHEIDGSTITVPLTADWTTLDDVALAACATSLPDGRVGVDLQVLDTPHRLELVLDPEAGTFTADWPLLPMFRAGQPTIASMHAPA